MNIIILLLTLVFLVNTGYAQTGVLVQNGDRYDLVHESADPGEGHRSANIFARQVGDLLKKSFPSKVVDPSVSLQVYVREGKKIYRLAWSCRIVSVSPNQADYYFDRRGTLLSGVSISEAKAKVEDEIRRSDKVEMMRRSFQKALIPASFVRDSFSGSSSEGFWYIKEYFMVAPK